MASRSFEGRPEGLRYSVRGAAQACLILLLVAPAFGPVLAQTPATRAQTDALAKRAADRLAALQKEAESLATRERTLLAELRRFELDREIKVEEFNTLERDARSVRAKLADAAARARTLESEADRQRPDVEARMVALYKMGRAGYWRLLLDVNSLRDIGRAYRTAAALDRIDRERIEAHRRTLQALKAERAALQARAAELQDLEKKSQRARAAIDAAVAAHTGLVAQIDQRRDLNAQLAGELQEAQRRLQTTVAQMAAGHDAPAAALPLRPFRGALPWPADGVVLARFGTQAIGSAASSKSGIELSLPEGTPIHAVHEGVVVYAEPFTGYGNLVIVDHGDKAFSLYGHLGSATVKRGDRVDAGTTVGLAGRNPSGNPSLYFELRVDGQAVDPLQWLKRQ